MSLSGAILDTLVAEQIMQILQPAALELSMAAEQALRTERERLEAHWHQRRERAHYEAERAARQYRAVEPENRLVARALERQWEEALRHEQQIQEAYARFRQAQPPELTAQERAVVLRLAEDVPGLWYAPDTTATDRQEIVRVLVKRVTVEVQGDSEQVVVTFALGGGRDECTPPAPPRGPLCTAVHVPNPPPAGRWPAPGRPERGADCRVSEPGRLCSPQADNEVYGADDHALADSMPPPESTSSCHGADDGSQPPGILVDRCCQTVEHPGGDLAQVEARRLGTFAQSGRARWTGGDLGR
jgi:hypothetical protein